MSETNEKDLDKFVDDIYTGLETTVYELQRTLPEEVDGLSTKQLRRALKNVIAYPEIDTEDANKLTDREKRFNAAMMALRQAGVQLEIKAIGELQREHDLKQKEKEENQNG